MYFLTWKDGKVKIDVEALERWQTEQAYLDRIKELEDDFNQSSHESEMFKVEVEDLKQTVADMEETIVRLKRRIEEYETFEKKWVPKVVPIDGEKR